MWANLSDGAAKSNNKILAVSFYPILMRRPVLHVGLYHGLQKMTEKTARYDLHPKRYVAIILVQREYIVMGPLVSDF